MAKQRLRGQRALVTGASSGIGKELARVLAAEGANLVITARRKERLEDLAKELRDAHGIDVRVESADLADPETPQRLFDATEGAGIAVDLLINNAGVGAYLDFLEVDWERYERIMRVNMGGLTHLFHLFLPKMIERRHGRVMNVASIGAYMPCPTFALYAATKAYVRNLTEAVDYELKGTGVRAMVLCPGPTRTEFLEHANQKIKSVGEATLMSARRCAEIGVRKMLSGRRTVITGFMNWLSMVALRFVPRAMYPWIASFSMNLGVESVKELPAPAKQAALPGPVPDDVNAAPAAEESDEDAPPTKGPTEA